VGFLSDFRSTNLIMTDHEHFDIPDLFIIRQASTPSSLDENLKQKNMGLSHTSFLKVSGYDLELPPVR